MLKQSINQFRNIKGIHYKCWCWDASEFKKLKTDCKKNKLKYKIIDGQFFIQVKSYPPTL